MKSVYNNLVIIEMSGNLEDDTIYTFLVNNNCPKTAEHCIRVGQEARRVAEMYNANADSAQIAGYLHDISVVYPNEVRV